MKVYNENKTEVLETYDLELGYLKADKILKESHEAVPEVPAITVAAKVAEITANGGKVEEIGGKQYKVVEEFPNGGQSVEEIKETPAIPAKDAYDEYEDIQVYIPYTAEELAERKQQKYENRVVELLRKKYSLNQELAILRQRDEKPEEYQAYHDYAEQCKATAKQEILEIF